MNRLQVIPIVEGHGEVGAVRILLERLWTELLGGEHIQILRPIRLPKSQLTRQDGLHRAVQLASTKLGALPVSDTPSMILVLVDADTDCPGELGPQIVDWSKQVVAHRDVTCVVAKIEYETWFAAAAGSLARYLGSEDAPNDPEARGVGKRWVENHFTRGKYSPTADQASLTAEMDLELCRRNSPSFDKLCRELEARRSS